MKKVLVIVALAFAMTACIQTSPVKPEQPTQVDNLVKSCLEHGRYVIQIYDDAGNEVYYTFACRPMFKSKQPPQLQTPPPEVEQRNYLGPKAFSVSI